MKITELTKPPEQGYAEVERAAGPFVEHCSCIRTFGSPALDCVCKGG